MSEKVYTLTESQIRELVLKYNKESVTIADLVATLPTVQAPGVPSEQEIEDICEQWWSIVPKGFHDEVEPGSESTYWKPLSKVIRTHLLARSTKEQKPVVLSVEELEAMIDKWYWECRDRSHMNSPAKAKHEAMVKLRDHLLAHAPQEQKPGVPSLSDVEDFLGSEVLTGFTPRLIVEKFRAHLLALGYREPVEGVKTVDLRTFPASVSTDTLDRASTPPTSNPVRDPVEPTFDQYHDADWDPEATEAFSRLVWKDFDGELSSADEAHAEGFYAGWMSALAALAQADKGGV